MATTTTSNMCRTCLRSLTRQTQRQFHPNATTTALRPLSTSTRLTAKLDPTPPPPTPSKTPPQQSLRLGLSQPRRHPPQSRPAQHDRTLHRLRQHRRPLRECARQADYTVPQALLEPPQPPPQNAAGDHLGVGKGWWLEPKSSGGLGLDPTFNSWAQVCMLHMYILTVRLRGFPKEVVAPWHQNLLDHFFYAAEDKMVTWHEMSSRTSRNNALKQIWLQWRGVQLGYDEGLVKGDAVFATAVWRNLFKGSGEVDIGDLVRVSLYMRREIYRLGKVGDEVVYEGRVRFGDPKDVEVGGKARTMGRSFDEEDLTALRVVQGGEEVEK